MNKLWNYEARSVLRDKRKCVAVICGERPCLRAKELNTVLGSLNVNFFNGLSIIIEYHASELSRITTIVEDVYENIMETPWKYLEFKRRPVGTESCLLGQLMLRLLSKSLTLEELVITDLPGAIQQRDTHAAGSAFELPKLRILHVPGSSMYQGGRDFLRSLLAGAPNVQELQTIVTPQWIPIIPVEKLSIIKMFFIPFLYGEHITANEAIRLLDIFCASEPKLTSLAAYRPSFRGANANYYDRLASVVYSSSETLREVELDSFSVYSLSMTRRAKLFPPVLRNVENLKFEVLAGTDSNISRYFLRVPLAQMFPNVTRVKFFAVSWSRDYFRDNDEMEQNEIFPWPAVRELQLENVVWCDERVAEIGILFPYLVSLEVIFPTVVRESHVPFRQLWSSFPLLEKLVIDGKLEIPWETNFDAAFCGIHPQEVALLRRKDDQFLKTVNIVPAFAPITHMKSKRNIHLNMLSHIEMLTSNSCRRSQDCPI